MRAKVASSRGWGGSQGKVQRILMVLREGGKRKGGKKEGKRKREGGLRKGGFGIKRVRAGKRISSND